MHDEELAHAHTAFEPSRVTGAAGHRGDVDRIVEHRSHDSPARRELSGDMVARRDMSGARQRKRETGVPTTVGMLPWWVVVVHDCRQTMRIHMVGESHGGCRCTGQGEDVLEDDDVRPVEGATDVAVLQGRRLGARLGRPQRAKEPPFASRGKARTERSGDLDHLVSERFEGIGPLPGDDGHTVETPKLMRAEGDPHRTNLSAFSPLRRFLGLPVGIDTATSGTTECSMPRITTPAGVEIEYDTFGQPSDPALLLVMGFTAQLISWPEPFCRSLADGGHYVIRFDNRDSGLSSKFDGATPATSGPYTLSDMSDDAFALLRALNIEQAHIVGASMGGMIVQVMAIEHPERVLSLTSVMSTTGEPEFGQPAPEAIAILLTPPPIGREAFLDASKQRMIFMSKRYADVDKVRALSAIAYDRSFYPQGAIGQMAAMQATGSRADGLRKVTTPTLVIHGLDDTLIDPSGGRRTAELIAGARLMEVEDMGHDMPEPLWPTITSAILEHTVSNA